MSDPLWRKVKKMELGNPIITALVGLVVFYIGLKMFSGGDDLSKRRSSVQSLMGLQETQETQAIRMYCVRVCF